MKSSLVLIALFCSVLPTSAQSEKLYTNRDLSSSSVRWSRTVTPEEWAGIQARAFHPPPSSRASTSDGYPESVFLSHDAEWPFHTTTQDAIDQHVREKVYADRLWTDPVLAYQLQHPYGSHGVGRAPRPSSRKP